ncbi:MAG: hypothetical protein H0V41_10920 [Pseudonocardiales bacterium]|nr:hypothetical protein [Pseudonocardiales bacterium]
MRTTPGTDVTQLSAWARLRGHAGYTPGCLLAYQRGRLVGGALILCRWLAGVAVVGYLPYGPVIPVDAPSRQSVREALEDAVVAAGIAPAGSMRVDLSGSEQELRARAKNAGCVRPPPCGPTTAPRSVAATNVTFRCSSS